MASAPGFDGPIQPRSPQRGAADNCTGVRSRHFENPDVSEEMRLIEIDGCLSILSEIIEEEKLGLPVDPEKHRILSSMLKIVPPKG